MTNLPKNSHFKINDFSKKKLEKKKISMITCYDAAFAKIISETNIDVVLVGDSLGNVMLGFENTIPVKLDHMIHHTSSVARVLKNIFLCADMPFLTYHTCLNETIANAGRLIQEGMAHSVKLEGGQNICPHIEAIARAGIPVMGHLGFTPQSVHAIGGALVQGKTSAARQRLIDNAKALEAAGVYAIVLELVPSDLAKEITSLVSVPTIGIGAGPYCDGQVLVLHDLLGFDQNFNPKFLKKYADLHSLIKNAINTYDHEVKETVFPSAEHSY